MSETRADKVNATAKLEHQDRKFRDALKLYSKAASLYMEALKDAEEDAKPRVRTKFAAALGAAEQLQKALGLARSNPPPQLGGGVAGGGGGAAPAVGGSGGGRNSPKPGLGSGRVYHPPARQGQHVKQPSHRHLLM